MMHCTFIGRKGSSSTDGASGPAESIIQNLTITGAPAAPSGFITAKVNSQSAEGLALTCTCIIEMLDGRIVSGTGDNECT